MQIRVIRKAIRMLIVYILIIIGIFVLQFRTDSSIIEKIRNLHITLEKSDESGAEFPLKNKLQLAYNGLNLFIDGQNPATVTKNGTNQKEPLRLVNWSQNENSFTFYFTQDVKLTAGLSDLNSEEEADENYSDSDFYAVAELPEEISALYIPFKFNSYMKIENSEGNKILLAGKRLNWELNTPLTSENVIGFTKNSPRLSYAIHDDSQKFTFESIAGLDLASQTLFMEVRNSIKNNLISAFKANTVEANLSEQVAVSYIAAQAENGSYTSAVDEIPASIRRGKSRTYLSTPYFDSLVNMNKLLEAYMASTEQQISKAASSNSLDLFTIRNIGDFLCISKNPAAVDQILTNAANADLSHASLAQASGIIRTYVDLYLLNPDYAQTLLPALENCVARISDACNFDGTNLTISENDTFISVSQATELGMALLRYGQISGNPAYERSGYVIINSYLSGANSFDLRTLANLYPILFYDNTYYPHFAKINVSGNEWIWAWTCAKDINYRRESDSSVTLTIDFPVSYTHYLIIKGIPRFTSIRIYDVSFRSDPRFESYNSSGYVYQADTKTLLVKSRHKEYSEDIRLTFAAAPAAAPAPAPKPAARPRVIDISPEAAQAQKPAPAESAATSAAPATPVAPAAPKEENSQAAQAADTNELSVNSELMR